MKKSILLVSLFAVCLGGLVGCGHSASSPGAGAASSTDDAVQKIQNDPNMAPDVKEKAIAAVKSQATENQKRQSAAKS